MLHILSNFESPLTQFIFSGLHRADVRLIQYQTKSASLKGKLARWLEVQLPHQRLDWYYPTALIKQLDAIAPSDSVLIFAMGNTKDIRLLRKYLRGHNVHVFLWNPVIEHASAEGVAKALQRLEAIQALTSQIYSFDTTDVERYGLRYAPQPFRAIEAPKTPPVQAATSPVQASKPSTDADASVDFFFLGYDKGRLPFLTQFKQAAEAAGMRCHFHIIADPGKTYSADEQALLSTGYLSYADNIAQSQRARCLIDSVQATQSGATMRGVEALFLGKKLITTREQAIHEPDFNPTRTLRVRHDGMDMHAITAFLHTPLEPAPEALLREHEINTWLDRFL